MTKQDEFIEAVSSNDIHKVKLLLTYKNVYPTSPNYEALIVASKLGFIDIVKLLLKDKRIDPAKYRNIALRLSAQNGYVDIVKLLINNSKVNPSAGNNHVIRAIYRKTILDKNEYSIIPPKNGRKDSFDLLCNDHRVKLTLKEDLPELYYKLIKKEIELKLGEF